MSGSVIPDLSHRQWTVLRASAWRDVFTFSDLRRLHGFRDLFLTLSVHRINVRYRQSLLGGTWAVLQPVAMMAIFTVVFSRLVKMPSDGAPYALFAYAGLLPWTFFSTAVSASTSSLTGHSALVTKVYFPREIIPATYVVASLADLLIASTVLVALLLVYRMPLTIHVLFVVPCIAVLALLSLGVGLVLAAAQVRFRDVGVALPVVLQLLMFTSPVLYALSIVPAAWRPFYMLNPLTGLIDGFRAAVLGRAPDMTAFAFSLAVTCVLLPLAYATFKRIDRTMADVI